MIPPKKVASRTVADAIPWKRLMTWGLFLSAVFGNAKLFGEEKNAAHSPLTYVSVGDPGNDPDPVTSAGKVDYPFEISKYETTNQQYCDFLNAVCSQSDPLGLYNINMERGLFGGVRRIANDGRARYQPEEGWETLPVVYVSWRDAARYCNWRHYGCPSGESGTMGITEGDAERGAYDTTSFSANARTSVATAKRNANARYWLPSLDEWIKSAYYDPTKNHAGGYWMYPVRSDVKPRAVAPSDDALAANYYDSHWAAPSPYLTPAGACPRATSHYGTCDQGGNAWEWLETPRGRQRCVMGGAATNFAYALSRTNVDAEYPDHELYIFGFRICRLPPADSP